LKSRCQGSLKIPSLPNILKLDIKNEKRQMKRDFVGFLYRQQFRLSMFKRSIDFECALVMLLSHCIANNKTAATAEGRQKADITISASHYSLQFTAVLLLAPLHGKLTCS
jgi:hypothetical protein